MFWYEYIFIAIAVGLVALPIVIKIINKKKGKSGCCGCEGCAMNCSKRK